MSELAEQERAELRNREDQARYVRNFRTYWGVLIAFFVSLILIAISVLALAPADENVKDVLTIPSYFANDVTITNRNVYHTASFVVWVLLVILLKWRFESISSNKQATILVFGRAVFNVSGMPIWLLPFCDIVYGPGPNERLQRELPADYSKVWLGKSDEKPDDKVLPFFINTGGKENFDPEKDDPMRCRLNMRVTGVISFTCPDLTRAFNVFGDVLQEEMVGGVVVHERRLNIENVFGQLTDTFTGTLVAYFGGSTPYDLTQNQEAINTALKKALDEKVKTGTGEIPWGIDVQEARLTTLLTGYDLNLAMQNVAEEMYQKQASMRKTEAAAYEIAQKLSAQAMGINDVSNMIRSAPDPEVVLRFVNAQLAKEGLVAAAQGGKIVIMAGGAGGGVMSNGLGLVEGIDFKDIAQKIKEV